VVSRLAATRYCNDPATAIGRTIQLASRAMRVDPVTALRAD